MLAVLLAVLTSCSEPPAPIPDTSPTGPPVPPSTEFAPLAADATKGLGTGANDFDTGLAAAGDTVVTSSIVYGNRLAPAFRLSTDAGATWQLGGLSEAGAAATPPDQGDQTYDVAVSTVDGAPRWVALGSSWRQPLTWHSTDGGRTFRQQVMDRALESEDVVSTVSTLRSGFAITAERIEGTSRPVVLLSPDGATWRDLPLTVGVAGPDEGAVIGAAVGVKDDLWLLIRTTNPAGAGTRLLVQPTG